MVVSHLKHSSLIASLALKEIIYCMYSRLRFLSLVGSDVLYSKSPCSYEKATYFTPYHCPCLSNVVMTRNPSVPLVKIFRCHLGSR